METSGVVDVKKDVVETSEVVDNRNVDISDDEPWVVDASVRVVSDCVDKDESKVDPSVREDTVDESVRLESVIRVDGESLEMISVELIWLPRAVMMKNEQRIKSKILRK